MSGCVPSPHSAISAIFSFLLSSLSSDIVIGEVLDKIWRKFMGAPKNQGGNPHCRAPGPLTAILYIEVLLEGIIENKNLFSKS